MRRGLSVALGLTAIVALWSTATADMVTLGASKDNTLYEDAQGDRSNGAGQYFFVGFTGPIVLEARRGLIQFDVAGSVPSGATIDSVRLRLFMDKTNNPGQTVALHRVTADWGEGASDADDPEGNGAAAATGDATWLNTFFNTGTWAAPGGDFSATTSASTNVTAIGSYNWGTTATMTSDVQGWLDNPGTNFGWILLGDESGIRSAQRFTAKEDTIPANRPALIVHFTVEGGCDCPFQADINGDTFVDATDLALEIDLVFFGASDVQDPDCPRTRGDFNGDGFADATDLALVIDYVFFGGAGPSDPCM